MDENLSSLLKAIDYDLYSFKEFDKKTGRKIAYSKAFLEGYRKFHRIINASIEALVNKHIDLSHTRDNLEAIINDEKSYLDKLRNCEKCQLL